MHGDHFARRRRTDRNRTRPRDARRDRDRRDASGGWREEYRTQETPVPDGGRADRREDHVDADAGDDVEHGDLEDDGQEYDLPEPADHVADRDGETDDVILVIETFPDATASGWYIEDVDATLAEVNQDYDPASPVVRGVYADALGQLDGWRTIEDVRDAVEFGAIRAYDFPADRLEPTTPGGETA